MKPFLNKFALFAVVALLFQPLPASCFESADLFLEKPRAALEEKGLSFEATYMGDMVSNLQGGLRQKTTYLGNISMALTYDLGQAGLIPGGKMYISANNSHGGEPTLKYNGDLQTADNLEAPNKFRLYEWWYEQNFLSERLSVLGGVYGLDGEFAITEYGGLFLNSSFGTPPELSANVPASSFPFVGPGVRVKVKPHEEFEFLAAVVDGDPTENGKNEHGVHYRLSSRQGLISIFELAYQPTFVPDLAGAFRRCFRALLKKPGADKEKADPVASTFKFGSWLHTQNVDDVLAVDEAGEPVRHRDNYGFYGIVDQMIFREKNGDDQGLGVFFQFGGAPDSRNTVDYYFGTGLHYKGIIPKRDRDILGVAVANAFLSERMQKSRDLEIEAFDPEAGELAGELVSRETALETTYRIQLHDRLALQPSYQMIFNPSGEQNIKTAHVFLLRFEVTF